MSALHDNCDIPLLAYRDGSQSLTFTIQKLMFVTYFYC